MTQKLQEQKSASKRYKLPADYFKPSTISSTVLIFFAFSLAILPGLLTRHILYLNLSLPWTIFAIVPLSLLSAQGMLLVGWIGHEGSAHLSLYRNKWASMLTGLFVASALPTYLELGFAVSHLNHHRFANQASDPDIPIFGAKTGIVYKLFLARLIADFYYIRNVLLIAFKRPLPYPYPFPFKGSALFYLAWANLLMSTLWLIVYAWIAINEPLTALVCLAFPFTIMFVNSSLQPYLEHVGTQVGLGIDARSRTSPLLTLLYAGNNYHLEHHLYPGVPCYKLPAVHNLLVDVGFYETVDAFIEPSLVKVYATAIQLNYPEPDQTDSQFNPLIRENNHC